MAHSRSCFCKPCMDVLGTSMAHLNVHLRSCSCFSCLDLLGMFISCLSLRLRLGRKTAPSARGPLARILGNVCKPQPTAPQAPGRRAISPLPPLVSCMGPRRTGRRNGQSRCHLPPPSLRQLPSLFSGGGIQTVPLGGVYMEVDKENIDPMWE